MLYHFSKAYCIPTLLCCKPSLWFDQGMLFRELEQWQSQKQTVFPMLMTTVGTHEQGGPHTQFNQRINKDDFFKVLEKAFRPIYLLAFQ